MPISGSVGWNYDKCNGYNNELLGYHNDMYCVQVIDSMH